MKTSVALCTYNGATHIRHQLTSIVGQSVLPNELIVNDDRSSDGTVDIVREVARSAPFNVRITVHESNLGSTLNFADAIRQCSGDVIFLADQDDEWHPQKIEHLLPHLADPSVGLVFTDALLVDADLRPLGTGLWEALRLTPAEHTLLREGRPFEALLKRNLVTGATAAFRSDLRDLILPLPDGLGRIHDGWIALICSATSRVVALDEPTISYRQHAAQQLGAPLRLKSSAAGRSLAPLGSATSSEVTAELQVLQDDLLCLVDRLDDPDIAARYPTVPSALALAQDVVGHTQLRLALPGPWHRRVPAVVRELRTGRYGRYSNGVRSALKDMSGLHLARVARR